MTALVAGSAAWWAASWHPLDDSVVDEPAISLTFYGGSPQWWENPLLIVHHYRARSDRP